MRRRRMMSGLWTPRGSLDRTKWEQVVILRRRLPSPRGCHTANTVQNGLVVATGGSTSRTFGVGTSVRPTLTLINISKRIRHGSLDADQSRHAIPPSITLVQQAVVSRPPLCRTPRHFCTRHAKDSRLAGTANIRLYRHGELEDPGHALPYLSH